MARRKKQPTTLIPPNRAKGGFFPLSNSLMHSDDYRTLSNSSKLVLLSICSNYNGYNGTPSTPIICTYEQMQVRNRRTIATAIKALEGIGWIVVARYGGLMRNPNGYAFGKLLKAFYK